MLGRTRRQLALIRYYSAARPNTAWSRATDVALAAALVLAWPTVWVLDRTCISQRPQLHVTGSLFGTPEGAVWAWVSPGAVPDAVRGDSALVGAFRLIIQTEHHGWPFASSLQRPQAQLGLELFSESQSKQNVDLPLDSPLRSAIETAVLEAGYEEAVEAWRETIPRASHRVAAWLANGLVWYLLLTYTAWSGVAVVRLGWRFVAATHQARRQRRQRKGRCITCGYDLRGSPFSERCPECGLLLE